MQTPMVCKKEKSRPAAAALVRIATRERDGGCLDERNPHLLVSPNRSLLFHRVECRIFAGQLPSWPDTPIS